MKHLYIIGNGFDIFSGLRTKYVDFRHWLQYSYPFIYENMSEAYEMDGEWWHNFEIQLGKLDVPRYVRKFTRCLYDTSTTLSTSSDTANAYDNDN